jgi:precorrin-6A/cobalt-precorrin-6A reductase
MRVLILGGTTEASEIARALADDDRFEAVLSFAGRTRAPAAPPIAWRSGGFGGAAGLAAYLASERIDALIDATHPFAVNMKTNAATIAIPRVAVLRPPWTPVPGDDWTTVASVVEAAAALGSTPRRVFLTVGQTELGPFGPPHHYLIRSVDPPLHPPPGAIVIAARGPFTAAGDQTLIAGFGADTLVTKNSGGAAVAGKLEAARSLGLEVIMVARPPPPPPPIVPDAAGALEWLHAQAALRGV